MELNYKQFGQGEPIIILHGLFGTLDNWQTIAKQLAKHYMVFIIDQRNHGKSPHSDEFSYPILAEDLKHFMESKWVYKATIIGHSMGGKTAMQFALMYPDMVEKLVIVDIAPKAYKGGHQEIFEAMFGLDLDNLTDRQAIDEELKIKIPEDGVRLFLMKNLSREKDGSYRWKMNLPVLYKEYQAILSNIDSEETFDEATLFIRGENSKYIKDDDVLDIQDLFPMMQLQTIENAGHWVHAENPKSFLAKLNTFLNL
jgi:pimeloyl-ACP methyl ester carboxylesterase